VVTPHLGKGESRSSAPLSTVTAMQQSLLQQHLDDVRAELKRAINLFGQSPATPPTNVIPDETAVKKWVT